MVILVILSSHPTSSAVFGRAGNAVTLQPLCQSTKDEKAAEGSPGLLTEAEAVTDRCLCQQDGPVGLASDLIRNPAEPDPAGVHCIHDVGGSNIGVNDPERNSTERYLRG